MRTRERECARCGERWTAAHARFCGTCGERLRSQADPGHARPGGATGVRSRWVLISGVLLVAAVTGTALLSRGSVEPPSSADGEVALPDELGAPAQLTPEQRDSLGRFRPDRLRCEPQGCEEWRLMLDHPAERVAVGHGWLAVLDGAVLRLRGLGGTTSHLDAGPSWSGLPPYDHDLAGRFTAREDPDDPDAQGEGHGADATLDLLTDPPEQLLVLPDGAVVLRWYDRLAALETDGELRWEIPADIRTFRYIEEIDGDLLVLRDDLAWPEGTTGPRPSADPIVAEVRDARDGRERWSRYTLAPRDITAGGLLITTIDGSVELVDLSDGTTRWRRPRGASERIQSTGAPWLVVARPDRALLLDAATGVEVADHEMSALLTPFQPVQDRWIAAWIDGGIGGTDGTTQVTLTALDTEGQEVWRVTLSGPTAGACCPAALPWVDGTIAVFDPAARERRWVTIDDTTGRPTELPATEQPRLPLPYDPDQRVHATGAAGDGLLQWGDGQLALLTADGQVRVRGADDLEVVAVDPLVLSQGRELLGVRAVP